MLHAKHASMKVSPMTVEKEMATSRSAVTHANPCRNTQAICATSTTFYSKIDTYIHHK